MRFPLASLALLLTLAACSPDRAVGKLVRIEGTAQNVHEQDGETSLTIALDLVGRETIEITLPGLANDNVVNGAEVVIYGISVGSHTMQSRLHDGEQIVPEVLAFHVDPPIRRHGRRADAAASSACASTSLLIYIAFAFVAATLASVPIRCDGAGAVPFDAWK